MLPRRIVRGEAAGYGSVGMDNTLCVDGTAEARVNDPDAVPVCSHCFQPVSPLDHYCDDCGEAVGQWTAYIPWVNIPYLASFFERLWMRIWWRRDTPLRRRLGYLMVIVLLAAAIFELVVMLVAGIPFVVWRRLTARRTEPGPGV